MEGAHSETTIASPPEQMAEDTFIDAENEAPEAPENEPTFTEKELIFEEYADTPMAYSVNDTVYTANGSAEAIMLCEFLQNEKLPAAFFSVTFANAAAFAIEVEETKKDEQSTADEEEGDDTLPQEDAEKNALTANESKPSPKAEVEKVSTTTNDDEQAKDSPVEKSTEEPEQSTPGEPATLPKPPKESPVSKHIEKIEPQPKISRPAPKTLEETPISEVKHSVPPIESASEPLDTNTEAIVVENELPATDSIEAPTPVYEDAPVHTIDTPEVTVTLEGEIAENTTPQQESTIETPLADYLEKTSEIEPDSVEPEVPQLVEQQEAPDDEAAPETLTVEEGSTESDPAPKHELEEPAITVHELLSSLAIDTQPITEEETAAEEFEHDKPEPKLTQLFACLDAQVAQFYEEAAQPDVIEKPVTVEMIQKTLELVLEEAGEEESALLAKFYIERYGVVGVLGAIRPPTTVSENRGAHHAKKLARLVMELLVHHDNKKEFIVHAA